MLQDVETWLFSGEYIIFVSGVDLVYVVTSCNITFSHLGLVSLHGVFDRREQVVKHMVSVCVHLVIVQILNLTIHIPKVRAAGFQALGSSKLEE